MFSTADGEAALAAGSRRCAVLGSPIAHSLSPVLHNAGYAALGLDWRYSAIECDAAALPDLVRGLGQEWAGLSVTMPGKAAAAAVADRRSPRVQALAAANTLVRRGSGWYAENTDVDGVIGALRAPGIQRPGRVLLLGTGGTALSVLAALAELGVGDVLISGRRAAGRSRALQVAADLRLPAADCEFDVDVLAVLAVGIDLVVSTVPAGAADQLAAVLAGVPALLDVVYHPWPTPLAAAGAADRVTVTGLDMLLHQALRQFELFTGRPAPAAAMRSALRSAVVDGASAPPGT